MLRRRSLFSLYLPGRKDWAGALATGVPVDRGINTSRQHGLDLCDQRPFGCAHLREGQLQPSLRLSPATAPHQAALNQKGREQRKHVAEVDPEH